MKKTIKIDINSKDDLFKKYNNSKISSDLINYIIEEAMSDFNKEDKYEIIINNKTKSNIDIIPLIKNELKEEYNNVISNYDENNIRQLMFLILGIITLFISVLIKEIILSELTSVGVWVLFWHVIEIELFDDKDLRKKRKILKKLLESKFIEK